ncbi:hypothetical protein PIB30_008334 [Stylosanthes scabra]|uniref:F-box domain-containing protein n=1 Tax=Stylosanthes scabra TaxID=79078 RepID=A0ABU6T4Q3_9FABA|nr:hypothetical protein [Stylosanthes scabra]
MTLAENTTQIKYAVASAFQKATPNSSWNLPFHLLPFQMNTADNQQLPLSALPDKLLLEIFARTDGRKVGRSRSLSTFWRDQLTSDNFIYMHLKRAKARATSTFVHFGMKGTRAIGSWVMRFDTQTGTREALSMPFIRNNQGRIDIVGSENGNIAVRYVREGRPPILIVWNPTTSRVSGIDDPMIHVGSFGICAYAFAYVPDTLDYN